MNINDDLTSLVTPGGAPQTEFRQGVIITFVPSTGANTVNVAGSVLTNVPTINPTDAVNYTVGSVVLLARFGASWVILGRPQVLGSPGQGAVSTDSQSSINNTMTGFTTTYANYATASSVAPAWANEVAVSAITQVVCENPLSSASTLRAECNINGSGLLEGLMGVPALTETTLTIANPAVLTITGGATTTVASAVKTASAWSFSAGVGAVLVSATFIYTRV